jgi:hypothetical protein
MVHVLNPMLHYIVFLYVFATLPLKCSCTFGTGARWENMVRWGMGDRGAVESRGHEFRSIMFCARGQAGVRKAPVSGHTRAPNVWALELSLYKHDNP